MGEVLVRDLSAVTIERLKRRARRNRRSLQAELKQILEEAAPLSIDEFRARADTIRESLRGHRHSDSVRLVREDRDR
jgi:plasmid stability protein